MPRTKKSADTILKDSLYPIMEAAIKKNESKYKKCVEKFIHANHEQLYDYAPIDRIYWKQKDVNDYFHSVDVSEKEQVLPVLKSLYYWGEKEKQACKDPYSMSQLMVVRYYIMKKDSLNAELATMYLAFSGKFYASCHYKWFRTFVPKREVMDYVINHMLSKKFDLVTQKSVWGAIRVLVQTWIKTYGESITHRNVTDEDFVYSVHQLYERIYSFLRNIAKLYYQAYEQKLYQNYESDNYDSDNGKYRIANTNSGVAAAITEKTMNYFTTNNINVSRCHAAAGTGVDPNEIKSIFENILNNNDKLDQLREVINILISDFMKAYPNEKDITNSIDFINYSIKAKPNTKDPNLIKLKNTIIEWLNTSERFRAIRTPNTRNNYYRGILIYIVLTINVANKED